MFAGSITTWHAVVLKFEGHVVLHPNSQVLDPGACFERRILYVLLGSQSKPIAGRGFAQ